MIIDMHNHTSRYSPCSLISPSDLITVSIEKGLDGICITEHDTFWPASEQKKLVSKFGKNIRIFFGAEITTSIGHVLSFSGVVKKIKDIEFRSSDNTAFIWAHPFRWRLHDDIEINDKLLKKFDAVELYNGNLSDKEIEYASNILKKFKPKMTGGSDTHSKEMAGRFATEFENSFDTIEELVYNLKCCKYKPVLL
jgi:predicted metal-dependent phosphoesterase TrpH